MRLKNTHKPEVCACCVHINLFYRVFRPALMQLLKLNNRNISPKDHVCGILTFLEGCLHYGYFTDEHQLGKILTNGGDPETFDYTALLDNIVNAQANLKNGSRSSYNSRLRALLYKYKRFGFKSTEESVPKENLKDELKENPSSAALKETFATEFKERTPPEVLTINLSNTTIVGKKKRKSPKPKSKMEPDDKIPTKGSLKRKRWFLDKMKTDDKYEDDIFEKRPFFRLSELDEASSSSSDYTNVGTPSWFVALSPRAETPSPVNEEFVSETELQSYRKNAEEYQHRRQKRRTKKLKDNSNVTPPTNEIKDDDSNQPPLTYATINPPRQAIEEDYDSDEIRDDYFSDSDEDSGQND